jgi:hypothetical protein
MRDVSTPDCPAVPLPGTGTAGQSVYGTDIHGTDCGTATGTLSLKALASRVLMRDKPRDARRDSATQASVIAVPAATSPETCCGTELGLHPAAILSADGPSTSCRDCGANLFWRLSVLSGGPGPWTCRRCEQPDPATWLDSHALPTVQT